MRTSVVAVFRCLLLVIALIAAPAYAQLVSPTIALSGEPTGVLTPGEPISVSVSVASGVVPATGTVRFQTWSSTFSSYFGDVCPAQPLVLGSANCAYNAPGEGSYALRVEYSGDITTAPGTSDVLYQTVRDTTSISQTGLPSGVVVPGTSFTATATVSTTGPFTPTGSVRFMLFNASGTSYFGDVCASGTLNASRQATCTFTAPAEGSYQIRLEYSGDFSNAPFGVSGFLFDAVRSSTSITQAGLPSGVVVPGASFTAIATVSTTGAFTPTGSVRFMLFNASGTSYFGDVCSSGTLNASRQATCTFTAPAEGSYQIRLEYSGDFSNAPFGISGFMFDAVRSSTSIAQTGLPAGNVVPGKSFTAIATVSTAGPFAPTGSVRFMLFNASGTSYFGDVCASGTLNASRQATCTFTAPAEGSYQIRLEYSGDFSNAPFGVSGFMFDAVRSTVTLTQSGIPAGVIAPGVSLTSIATAATSGPFAPTGSVRFMQFSGSGSNYFGDFCASGVLNGSQEASCTFTTPSEGSYLVKLSYSGDFSNAPAELVVPLVTQRGAVTITQAGGPTGIVSPTASFTMVATVASGGPVPTGSAIFRLVQSGSVLRDLCAAQVLDASGRATCAFGSIAEGSGYAVRVEYGGDPNTNPGSQDFPFTVARVPRLVVLEGGEGFDFAAELMGRASAPQTLRIQSAGEADLVVSLAASAHFAVGALCAARMADGTCSSPCPAAMPPGTTCDAQVGFTPGAMGSLVGSLNLGSNDPSRASVGLPLSGLGAAPPTVSLSLPATVAPGQVVPIAIVITNPAGNVVSYQDFVGALDYPAGFGNDPALPESTCPQTLVDAWAPGNSRLGFRPAFVAALITETDPRVLAPGASCVGAAADVIAPAVPGSHVFTLPAGAFSTGTFGYSNPAPVTATINVVSISGPKLGVSPASIDFGARTLDTTSPVFAVTVANAGDVPVNIASIGTTGDFGMQSGCPAVLATGATCNVDLTFKPLVEGTRSGSLDIRSDAAGSPHVVSLTGVGTPVPVAMLEASPSVLEYAPQAVGTESAPRAITLRNTGNAALTLMRIVASAEFPRREAAAPATACGERLDPGASCDIAFGFRPAEPGLRSSSLFIESTASNQLVELRLVGNGVAAPPPRLLRVPQAIEFGPHPVGTASDAILVPIENLGATGVSITELAASGDFSVSDNCTLIAARSPCAARVVFRPSARGSRSGTLTIRTFSETQPYTVALHGTGTPNSRPALALSLTRVGFGNALAGVPIGPVQVQVTNVGEVPVALNGLSAPAHFLIESECGATLAPAASCVVNVSFYPRLLGAVEGHLEVRSNAEGAPHRVELSGTGCAIPSVSRARARALSCTP